MARPPVNPDLDGTQMTARQAQRAQKNWERAVKAQQARRSQKASRRTVNSRRSGRRAG